MYTNDTYLAAEQILKMTPQMLIILARRLEQLAYLQEYGEITYIDYDQKKNLAFLIKEGQVVR